MRAIGRSCLIAFLIAGLLNFPTAAANERALGLIIQAEKALLGSAEAVIGATVYPGDELMTHPGGTMRLKVGAGQLYLLSASAVKLEQNESAVRAFVERGTVGFTSAMGSPVELDTPEGIVRAENNTGYGQVTITGPREMTVTSYKGNLIVEYQGELYTIAEGKSYSVTLALDAGKDTAEPQGPTGSGVRPAVNRHLLVKLIALGVVAVATYFVWRELCESSEKFEKCN